MLLYINIPKHRISHILNYEQSKLVSKSYETGNMIMECTENAYRHLPIIHSLRPISKRTNNSIKFVSFLSKFLKEETMIMRRTNLGKT